MNYPPLSLVDDTFFIDHSSLEAILTCHRSAGFKLLYKRIPAGVNPALNFGGAMHSALEWRYRTDPPCSGVADLTPGINILKNWFIEKPNPVGEHRTPDLAIALLQEYNLVYPCEEFHVVTNSKGEPAVELSFAFPLGSIYLGPTGPAGKMLNIMWTGKIDVVAQERNTRWIMDHKTSSILGDGFFRSEAISGQHRGYAWAHKQAFGYLPDGYIINAIRVPKPTIKGGLGVKNEGFQRAKNYISEHEVEEWREETLSHLQTWLTRVQWNMPLHANRKWCVHKYGTCSYYDVCMLPKDSRESMLLSGVFEENTWSPLKPLNEGDLE